MPCSSSHTGQSKQLLTRYRMTAALDEGQQLSAASLQLSVSDYFIAGGLTGAASCLVECPVDLLKSQLQTVIYRPDPPFASFTSAVTFVLRHRGVRGLYQGLGPTFLRTIPSTAAYFGCYEWVRSRLSRDQGEGAEAESEAEHSAVILVAGGVGGFAYWLSTYPADVVKVSHSPHSQPPPSLSALISSSPSVCSSRPCRATTSSPSAGASHPLRTASGSCGQKGGGGGCTGQRTAAVVASRTFLRRPSP